MRQRSPEPMTSAESETRMRRPLPPPASALLDRFPARTAPQGAQRISEFHQTPTARGMSRARRRRRAFQRRRKRHAPPVADRSSRRGVGKGNSSARRPAQASRSASGPSPAQASFERLRSPHSFVARKRSPQKKSAGQRFANEL